VPGARQRPFASALIDAVLAEEWSVVSGVHSRWNARAGRRADVLCAGESLDDDHRRPAVPAHEGGLQGSTCGVGFAGRGGKEGRGLMQEFVSGGDVVTRSGRSRSLEADIQIARSGRSPMHRVRPTCARAPPPAPAGRPCGRRQRSADRPCNEG